MRINTLNKYDSNNISINPMCPMASLFDLIEGPCKSILELFSVYQKEADFSLQNKQLAAILKSFLVGVFLISKMPKRGPKIVHPEHPLIQLLGAPSPERIPDLRDYDIPPNYGKKTSFL